MKQKINEFQSRTWHEIERRLKRLCGRPSPVKRLIAVLFIGGLLAAANIYYLVSSIYHIGKKDAEIELMKLQHIERLELPKRESIHQLKHQEYDEQQSNDRRE